MLREGVEGGGWKRGMCPGPPAPHFFGIKSKLNAINRVTAVCTTVVIVLL